MFADTVLPLYSIASWIQRLENLVPDINSSRMVLSNTEFPNLGTIFARREWLLLRKNDHPRDWSPYGNLDDSSVCLKLVMPSNSQEIWTLLI